MKFHLKRASDHNWKDIDIIEVNSLDELKELSIQYKACNETPYDINRIIIDFDTDDNTDGTIIIYDDYVE